MKVDVERFGFYEYKVLKKFIITEMFNVELHNKFNKFWIISIFPLSSNCRI